jgi:transglutaminase-like putative cysteine protease
MTVNPPTRMFLHVLHRTTFLYAGGARDSFNELRLRPVDDYAQTCRRFGLALDPGAQTSEYSDFYGNTVIYFDVSSEHNRLMIEAQSEVETVPNSARLSIPTVAFADLMRCPEREMYAEFFTDSHYVPLAVELWREMQDALADGRTDVWNDVVRLGEHVFRALAYRPDVTGVSTRAVDALRLRAGVCQDFAHVMLGMCRCAGIPARYVSGYFLNPQRRPGEIEASHAWIEAFVPGYGWAAYDPTHNRTADERYVKLAVGRDYADIRPVSGTYRGAPTVSLQVEVIVRNGSFDPQPADFSRSARL